MCGGVLLKVKLIDGRIGVVVIVGVEGCNTPVMEPIGTTGPRGSGVTTRSVVGYALEDSINGGGPTREVGGATPSVAVVGGAMGGTITPPAGASLLGAV